MDNWKEIVLLAIPMLMNWWEVRGLRKEMRADMRAMEDRHQESLASMLAAQVALDIRVSALEKRLAQD